MASCSTDFKGGEGSNPHGNGGGYIAGQWSVLGFPRTVAVEFFVGTGWAGLELFPSCFLEFF